MRLQVIESPAGENQQSLANKGKSKLNKKRTKYIITTEWEFAVRAASAKRNVCLALSGYKTASLKTP